MRKWRKFCLRLQALWQRPPIKALCADFWAGRNPGTLQGLQVDRHWLPKITTMTSSSLCRLRHKTRTSATGKGGKDQSRRKKGYCWWREALSLELDLKRTIWGVGWHASTVFPLTVMMKKMSNSVAKFLHHCVAVMYIYLFIYLFMNQSCVCLFQLPVHTNLAVVPHMEAYCDAQQVSWQKQRLSSSNSHFCFTRSNTLLVDWTQRKQVMAAALI